MAPSSRGGPCRSGAHRAVLQVFVELNELVVDKNQELQWKETARWIKFEEDVEEETDRWGKPHVASLSFRSLLELRKTLSHGRVAGQPHGVRVGGHPRSCSPQPPSHSPRGRAPRPGPEDAAGGGSPGGGADGHHRPDPGRGPRQRAAGAAAQAQVSTGGSDLQSPPTPLHWALLPAPGSPACSVPGEISAPGCCQATTVSPDFVPQPSE